MNFVNSKTIIFVNVKCYRRVQNVGMCISCRQCKFWRWRCGAIIC